MFEQYIGYEASMYAVFYCLGLATAILVFIHMIVYGANRGR